MLPQTLDVMKTRAKYFGFELVQGHPEEAGNGDYFGALFQYPGEAGDLLDLTRTSPPSRPRAAWWPSPPT
ncbi:Glycine dehydrogenase [decarboxylating] [Chromobacterium violaceum]|uniref:Glycine dehydrogenase [decarboxylating] n=1 Tax=Chromobacterium violaceum TaxID=536 RepID=A0A3S4HTU5_CHRVL|nr:Glycine dehydrogenase [decarboxylating] [Chromobacterium violaceum]